MCNIRWYLTLSIPLTELVPMRASRLVAVLGSFVALVGLVVIAACGSVPGAASSSAAAPGPAARPAQATPERIAAGKLLYEKGVCITCHGRDGVGSQNAPPLNDRNWLHGAGTFGQIVQTIVNGFSVSDMVGDYSRAMPVRGENSKGARVLLNDDQVASVAAYVWSLSHDIKPGGH